MLRNAIKYTAPSSWKDIGLQKDLRLLELISLGEFKSILTDQENSSHGLKQDTSHDDENSRAAADLFCEVVFTSTTSGRTHYMINNVLIINNNKYPVIALVMYYFMTAISVYSQQFATGSSEGWYVYYCH